MGAQRVPTEILPIKLPPRFVPEDVNQSLHPLENEIARCVSTSFYLLSSATGSAGAGSI